MKQKCVLVTAIGSVAGDVVIKELKKLGFRVAGCDIYPKEWLADAYNTDVFYQAPRADDTEKYLAFLKQICLSEGVDYVLPLIDVEVDVLNSNRAWFEENGITLCISPEESLAICRNKKRLEEYVNQNCPYIKTIPTAFLRDMECPGWSFPLVCKPYNGRSSINLHYIYDIDQWKGFIASADKDLYIVQPFVKGSRIVADVVCEGRGGRAAVVVRRELISTINGCGLSVYVYRDEALEDQCRRLAENLGIVGCVNFEFLLDDDGCYHLIECNPRFSGGSEFTCLSGYNTVRNHIRCFSGERIEEPEYGPNRYIARKYEEYVTRVDE